MSLIDVDIRTQLCLVVPLTLVVLSSLDAEWRTHFLIFEILNRCCLLDKEKIIISLHRRVLFPAFQALSFICLLSEKCRTSLGIDLEWGIIRNIRHLDNVESLPRAPKTVLLVMQSNIRPCWSFATVEATLADTSKRKALDYFLHLIFQKGNL